MNKSSTKQDTQKYIVLIGPSGAGKTTIAQSLVTKFGLQLHKKHTTRPPRPHETDASGEDIFINEDTFASMVNNREFIDTVQPFGLPYKYGMVPPLNKPGKIGLVLLRSFVLPIFTDLYPNCLVLHIATPEDKLIRRMQKRGQSNEDIQKRIKSAAMEISDGEKLSDYNIDSSNPEAMDIINSIVAKYCGYDYSK